MSMNTRITNLETNYNYLLNMSDCFHENNTVYIYGSPGFPGIPGKIGQKGETGSQGIQGFQGIQGLNGFKGDRGAQGISGYVGIQGPQGTVGAQGSLGPQGIGSQGIPGTQGSTGPQGPQGNSGATIFTGQGIPAIIGVSGDLYIDTLTNSYYLNVNNIWVFQGDFTGSQGPQGIDGPQGNQGSVGQQGNIGPQGIVGVQGFPGSIGTQGSQGNIGPQGPQGISGSQGLQGNIGSQGPQGNTGIQGPQGNIGSQGPIGAQGNQGIQGDVGSQGTQGSQGAPGGLNRQVQYNHAGLFDGTPELLIDTDDFPVVEQSNISLSSVSSGAKIYVANKATLLLSEVNNSSSFETQSFFLTRYMGFVYPLGDNTTQLSVYGFGVSLFNAPLTARIQTTSNLLFSMRRVGFNIITGVTVGSSGGLNHTLDAFRVGSNVLRGGFTYIVRFGIPVNLNGMGPLNNYTTLIGLIPKGSATSLLAHPSFLPFIVAIATDAGISGDVNFQVMLTTNAGVIKIDTGIPTPRNNDPVNNVFEVRIHAHTSSSNIDFYMENLVTGQNFRTTQTAGGTIISTFLCPIFYFNTAASGAVFGTILGIDFISEYIESDY